VLRQCLPLRNADCQGLHVRHTFADWGNEGYTSSMDRVRLGRALGFGARQAIKTLMTAVDAATAENPATKNGASSPVSGSQKPQSANGAGTANVAPRVSGERTAPGTPARKVAHATAKTVVQAREVKQGFRRGSKRFGEAVWGPFVRLSGVLWLEVAGVFFGIFALLAVGYLWKLRGAWHSGAANAASHRSLMGALIMLALFGYFSVSSFVRARQRERRR
jgi:hypothetical protein